MPDEEDSIKPIPEKSESEEKPRNLMGAGIAIGIAIGVAIGNGMDNIGAGIAIGIAIGVAIGSEMNKARAE